MSRNKQQIGIDIGARSVRAVWVAMRGGKPVVTRAETFALPLDAENPHKLVSAWAASLGVAKQFCAVALPGSQTIFQGGRIMHNDPRTPDQVAAMDIAQFNEMAGDTMAHCVDSFETPLEAGVRRYIMAMARPSAIAEAIQGTRRHSLRPADLVPAPVALYNALENLSAPHEAPHCFVGLGHGATEVAIGTSAGLLFARSVAVGGKLFTEAVTQATGLSAVQAEVRKHADCGLNEGDACCEALRAAADRWVSQFNACLGVYRSQFQDRKFTLTRIVLSGGSAQLKGLKEYLAAKLYLPVVTTAELEGLAPAHRPHAGAYDLAYGLALSAMGQGRTRLSLLPADLKNEVIFREKKPWWIAAAVLLLGSMALYSATGVYLLHRDGQLLESEREKLSKRERIDKHIQELRARQSLVMTNALPLGALLVNGPLAREVLTLVSQTVDPEDWITLFCDENVYTKDEQGGEGRNSTPQAAVQNPLSLFRTIRSSAAPAPAGNGKKELPARKELADALSTVFIVEGYTAHPGLKTVGEMIARLKTSPAIVRADLRRDDRVLAPTGIPELEDEKLPDFKRFVLEIEVKR